MMNVEGPKTKKATSVLVAVLMAPQLTNTTAIRLVSSVEDNTKKLVAMKVAKT
jgi:hypothetical protein